MGVGIHSSGRNSHLTVNKKLFLEMCESIQYERNAQRTYRNMHIQPDATGNSEENDEKNSEISGFLSISIYRQVDVGKPASRITMC